jgi:catechol 2,3-dioxygenase-like lactoylglutathione lyase family enzyme
MDITIHASLLPHDDPNASLAFYRDTLGFEVRNDVEYGGVHWITVDEFDEAYRRAGTLLDASPNCQRWEAACSVDDPEKQIVRIEWDSAEGHL